MSSVVRRVRVVDAPLSLDALYQEVRDDSVGGVALFVGVVRDVDEGREVSSLDYTQHPTAENTLRDCAERVAADHDLVAVAVEHRIGHLEIGDIAVVVAVGAIHRGEALTACRALIDLLKREVPIWKEQEFSTGATEWVGLS